MEFISHSELETEQIAQQLAQQLNAGMVLAYQGTTPCDFVALVVYVAACLTDYIDGNLARKNNQITNFGKFMDPVADKLLVMAALLLFVEDGTISDGTHDIGHSFFREYKFR